MTLKRVLRWLGSKAILYLVLVLAILPSAVVTPRLKSEWRDAALHVERGARLETVKDQLETLRGDTQRRLSKTAAEAQQRSVDELDRAIGEAERAKAQAEGQRRGEIARTKSLLTADTDSLLADGRLELEIQYRDREIAGLRAARERTARGQHLAAFPADLEAKLQRRQAVAAGAMASCNAARKALAAFEDRWEVRATFQLYDRKQHSLLLSAVRDRCTEAKTAYDSQYAAAVMLKQRNDAVRSYRQAQGWADSQVSAVTGDLEREIAQERAAAEGSWAWKLSLWAQRVHLSTVLERAATALTLLIATPYVIRLFCYFVLAPAAMRRPAVRFGDPGVPAAPIPLSDPSATSIGVRLAPGEELLVRQDYLQTTSAAGRKGTQWFLDWRHPVTSLVTGLTFLTRIHGEGEVTTVSAVRDPFAEVTLMTLPDGTCCVLQPRALAAVAQPIRRRLRVTGHWRLFSINAWLTLQLRYLVFHGPARLVLKGGRGVRLERAERGRIFEQDQLVGFSTDLAYSVTRSETFWPYFLGRERLLKDHVAAGDGVLIVEEAPMASGRPGEVRHGIEGMIDAGMKAFGM